MQLDLVARRASGVVGRGVPGVRGVLELHAGQDGVPLQGPLFTFRPPETDGYGRM